MKFAEEFCCRLELDHEPVKYSLNGAFGLHSSSFSL